MLRVAKKLFMLCLGARFIATNIRILVTTKAATKHELLFNKPAFLDPKTQMPNASKKLLKFVLFHNINGVQRRKLK
jgi:hypothetical protein